MENHMLGFNHELWYHISDRFNSHSKVSSRVEDCLYTYILPKEPHHHRCEMFNSPFRDVGGKRSIGNSWSLTSLKHQKLFMWKIIYFTLTMDSDTILVMSLTNAQKLALESRIIHTYIYIVQETSSPPTWNV